MIVSLEYRIDITIVKAKFAIFDTEFVSTENILIHSMIIEII